jgi:hypothetical protein
MGLGKSCNFLRKKLFRETRNRRKFVFIPSKFCLFCRTEKARNSIPNHSVEEKNTLKLIPNHRDKDKHLDDF